MLTGKGLIRPQELLCIWVLLEGSGFPANETQPDNTMYLSCVSYVLSVIGVFLNWNYTPAPFILSHRVFNNCIPYQSQKITVQWCAFVPENVAFDNSE